MRFTPIPDDEVWAGAVRKVFGPPDGDPTGSCRPVEAVVDASEVMQCPRIHLRVELDDGDLPRLEAGEPFWITWYGAPLHPVAVGMAEFDEPDQT